VAGTPVAGFNVQNGQSGTISMDSEQELVLTSSDAVTWTPQPNTAVNITPVKAATDTVLDDTLASPPGGDQVFTVASKNDPSVTATVTVKVAPQHFNAKAAVNGASLKLAETDTLVNGTTSTTTVGRTVTSVAADGSYTEDATDISGTVTDHFLENASGNRVTRTYVSNGNVCTYNPSREYANFPLFVGKTWTSSWQYSCVAGYHETANQTATVEAWEPVTVPAGTMDALRVNIKTTLTNSNDANLTNGNTGAATYSIALLAWYAPSQGEYVKYQFTYSYVGTAPGNYTATQTQELTP
jgi:hypothetical protein